MPKFIDLTGQTYHWLTVLKKHNRNNLDKMTWMCLCKCGKIIYVPTGSLNSGNTKSCGCYKKFLVGSLNKTHNKSRTCEYIIWQGILKRCGINKYYGLYLKNYAGRGIKVCKRWENSFENFYKDMGKRPSKNHSIDRINNNGDYKPSNCKWSTRQEQMRNTTLTCRKTVGTCLSIYGSYFSYIQYKKKRIHLGSFKTQAQAIKARKQAELKYWGKIVNRT